MSTFPVHTCICQQSPAAVVIGTSSPPDSLRDEQDLVPANRGWIKKRLVLYRLGIGILGSPSFTGKGRHFVFVLQPHALA